MFRQFPFGTHADATTPAEPLGAVSHLPQRRRPSPIKGNGSASASMSFEACSAFTRVPACVLAESPKVTRYIGVLQQLCYLHHRSDCFRLERPVAGWELHPLEIAVFHGVPFVTQAASLKSQPFDGTSLALGNSYPRSDLGLGKVI